MNPKLNYSGRKALAVCLLVGFFLAFLIANFGPNPSRNLGTALASSFKGIQLSYGQNYVRGHPAFVSGPQFIYSGSSTLKLVSLLPVVTQSCSITILNTEAYDIDSGNAGYVISGPWSANYGLSVKYGDIHHEAVTSLQLPGKTSESWIVAVTFIVPRNCVVHIRGFDIIYKINNERFYEYFADPGIFMPVTHL